MKRKEFLPKYFITEDGRVWSDKTNKYLKIQTAKLGYQYVSIYNNKREKNLYIHRLVAEAFIPRVKDKPEVNHKDLDKTNNHFSNLEWTDRSGNITHLRKSQNGGRFGVGWHKHNKSYRATVYHKNQIYYLGYSKDEEVAYQKVRDKYYELTGEMPW